MYKILNLITKNLVLAVLILTGTLILAEVWWNRDSEK